MSILPGDNDQASVNRNLRTTVGFVIGKTANPIKDLWNDYTEWIPWNVSAPDINLVVESRNSFYKRVGNNVELLLNISVLTGAATDILTFETLPFLPSIGMTYAGSSQTVTFFTALTNSMIAINPYTSLTQFTVRDPNGFQFPSTFPLEIKGRIRYRTDTDLPIFLS